VLKNKKKTAYFVYAAVAMGGYESFNMTLEFTGTCRHQNCSFAQEELAGGEEARNGNRSLICPDNLEPQCSASCGCTELNQSLFIMLIWAAVQCSASLALTWLLWECVISQNHFLLSFLPVLKRPLTRTEMSWMNKCSKIIAFKSKSWLCSYVPIRYQH